ncbi:WbqC family protein [Ramlibacter algicola]|uniref:WbqC family protein n=1 Tax=Ramlibacter algicola TaxID=2795217 RepID=A0A934Q0A2_9BURK|nr:WbqC family protein [Ramlibacter algicola]MBK0391932.1 WbqC family protein [Ramlibacter algicola]
MSRRVAIVQSNYLPWKGYFDLMASVDEFVLYDDVQYTRRDWRNRNQIKTPQGLQWLTVPVKVKGKYTQAIRDTGIDLGTPWAADHLKAIALNYRRAPHFGDVMPWLEGLYADLPPMLSQLNERLLRAIAARLDLSTRLTDSSQYRLEGDKSERLASIAQQAGASVYVSGPAARSYLDESVFHARGMTVEWFDYSGYAEYPQLWGDFVHAVSVVDLLLNCGPDASRFLKHAR